MSFSSHNGNTRLFTSMPIMIPEISVHDTFRTKASLAFSDGTRVVRETIVSRNR